jgi:hypothetical protein
MGLTHLQGHDLLFLAGQEAVGRSLSPRLLSLALPVVESGTRNPQLLQESRDRHTFHSQLFHFPDDPLSLFSGIPLSGDPPV